MADFDLGALLKGFNEGYSEQQKIKMQQEELKLKKKMLELEQQKATAKILEDFQMEAKAAIPEQKWISPPSAIENFNKIQPQMRPPWEEPVKPLQPSTPSTSYPPSMLQTPGYKPLEQLGTPNIPAPKTITIPEVPARERRDLTGTEAGNVVKTGSYEGLVYRPKKEYTNIPIYKLNNKGDIQDTIGFFNAPIGTKPIFIDYKNSVKETTEELEAKSKAREKGKLEARIETEDQKVLNGVIKAEDQKTLDLANKNKTSSAEDQEALDWANKNKTSPNKKDRKKAIEIIETINAKYKTGAK